MAVQSTRPYKLSQIAANEWKSFAMYTIEARAIPNMIDGLKPVQRMFLYSSIKNTSKEFKKVSAVAGVVSDYGYNHGETSAASAGQLMAAEWANNVCLIEGRGSFGTRLVNEAAAARYTYTKLHDNFSKYIRDVELAPSHPDPEHEPPAFYVPVIPLVLVNGIKGIGTGFKTDILPRDPADVARACRQYITTGSPGAKIQLKFPEFDGEIVFDQETGKYACHGSFVRKGKLSLSIIEVPYGYDREDYVKVLDKLEEQGTISGYDDLCDKDGFNFAVRLKQLSASWSDERILKEFKLVKTYGEILTVIGPDGALREYVDERQLIADFCDYRGTILQKRIDRELAETSELQRWLLVKMQFIQAVLDGVVTFKGNTKAVVTKQILEATEALKDDVDRLLKISVISLTAEHVTQLRNEIAEAKRKHKYWSNTTPKEQFLNDLNEIQK
jgi:DNA gyrase/topoisomerase IV subunit A